MNPPGAGLHENAVALVRVDVEEHVLRRRVVAIHGVVSEHNATVGGHAPGGDERAAGLAPDLRFPIFDLLQFLRPPVPAQLDVAVVSDDFGSRGGNAGGAHALYNPLQLGEVLLVNLAREQAVRL